MENVVSEPAERTDATQSRHNVEVADTTPKAFMLSVSPTEDK
jgi:hypothetical protein